MDKKDSTSKKLTEEENLFVEEVFHEIDYERAKEIVYAMPYSEWKEKYQK